MNKSIQELSVQARAYRDQVFAVIRPRLESDHVVGGQISCGLNDEGEIIVQLSLKVWSIRIEINYLFVGDRTADDCARAFNDAITLAIEHGAEGRRRFEVRGNN